MQEPRKNQDTFSDENYTPAELQQVYERAAQLQSEDTFAPADESVDREAALRSAGRAGIGNKYVEQAIEELRGEEKSLKAQQFQTEQQNQARQRLLKQAIAPLIGVLALFALLSYSSLNSKSTEVDAKQAQLQNVLQRRHDLIPNLIAASKAASVQDKQSFNQLSQLNQQARNAASFEDKLKAEHQLSGAVRGALGALPDEGNSKVFTALADEMAGAENRVSAERKRYNEAVQNYNRTAGAFPTVLFRGLFGFPSQKPYFQVEANTAEAPKF